MEFDHCVPHIYNPVEQKVMAGQFHAPSHPGVLKKLNMNGNILQRYFTIFILPYSCFTIYTTRTDEQHLSCVILSNQIRNI